MLGTSSTVGFLSVRSSVGASVLFDKAKTLLSTTAVRSQQSSFRSSSSSSRGYSRRAHWTRFSLVFLSGTTTSPAAFVNCYSSWSGGRSYYSNKMPFVTERSGDGTITVSPKNEADQSALVVIAHGLGDSAEGFADVAEMFADKLPHVKYILPTAPTQPVTMNMGMPMPSWYDIVGLDERANENCKGIEDSRSRLVSILDQEHAETGLPYSRMILVGFSQGGALSLFTGLQLPVEKKVAGIVVLSGYLPAVSKFQLTPGLEDVPILHCHGTVDPMVRYNLAEKSKAALEGKGCKSYTLEKYNIQHTVSMEELASVQQFLNRLIPADDQYKIKLKDPSEMSVKELRAAIRKAGLQNKAVGLMEKAEFVKLLQEYRNGKL